jgi:enoyl-CoA hydratase/carnithine racemase
MTDAERMNALHPELVAALGRAISTADTDPDVRSLVITGTGKAFCAGADLAFVRSLGRDATAISTLFLQPLSAVLRSMRSCPKPIIAAINGHCVAGGLELVLACDLVIAAESAKISDGHARYGLLPAIGGAHQLSHVVGTMKAKEMLFTGAAYSAAEMQAAGLVSRTVADDELHDTATQLAETLAERSPAGLRLMKQMVHDETEMSWDTASRYELLTVERHLTTDDPFEGLDAFAEGRKPRFGPDSGRCGQHTSREPTSDHAG